MCAHLQIDGPALICTLSLTHIQREGGNEGEKEHAHMHMCTCTQKQGAENTNDDFFGKVAFNLIFREWLELCAIFLPFKFLFVLLPDGLCHS